MTTSKALTKEEVEKFVYDWYHALDVHVPPAEAEAMVDMENVEFHIPEGIRKGPQAFRDMYHFWTNTFFDEVHTMVNLDVTPEGDQARVKLLVDWKARTWTPPEPTHKDIHFHAGQSWVVVRHPQTGRPAIQQYIVETFDPVEDTKRS